MLSLSDVDCCKLSRADQRRVLANGYGREQVDGDRKQKKNGLNRYEMMAFFMQL